jgi:methionyl-tRNA synthetase
MSKNFYITTPIYYVNDAPHIGHAYTTVLADVLTRYHKLMGYDCFFQTGTDEHGQKVQQAAEKRGIPAQNHVDEYNVRFKDLWERMNIDYDYFIRTTDPDHKAFVQKCLQNLFDKGEIYTKEYAGWYSVGEERFFGEDELVDGKDPISGRPVEWLTEKNYFFKMSHYQKALIQHIADHPDFIQPEFRKNEVLGFLKQELTDLCISRPKSRLAWGISLPFDDDYVTYVWFDALLNYVSGVLGRKFKDGSDMWPASYHLIGKDILTTHSIYWTTMLMGMGIPLPQHILAHGWWMNGGAKMSKSGGTAINPIPYMDEFGVDVFRYFLIRDMVIGQDASFSDENFFKRINSDLANDLGNGLNRVCKQIVTHFNSQIPAPVLKDSAEIELEEIASNVLNSVLQFIPELKLSQAVEEILSLVRAVNRYLEIKAPWKLAKDPSDKDNLATTLWYGAESLRLALTLLQPVIPKKAAEGLAMLGAPATLSLSWNVLKGGEHLGEQKALFPRILVEKENQPAPSAKNTEDPKVIGEFRVCEIVKVEDHPEADSLYMLSVHDGKRIRTVCAGLKNSYSVEELQNRKAVLFANLKPAKIRGILSEGMFIAADGPDHQGILPDASGFEVGTLLQFDQSKPEPLASVKIKVFEKLDLKVHKHKILSEGQTLGLPGKELIVNAEEGAEVH